MVVKIDGQLLTDCVGVAENCCLQALATGMPVCVFLRDVTAIDDAGRDLLCRLAKKGIRLQASGVYMSHIVKKMLQRARNPESRG